MSCYVHLPGAELETILTLLLTTYQWRCHGDDVVEQDPVTHTCPPTLHFSNRKCGLTLTRSEMRSPFRHLSTTDRHPQREYTPPLPIILPLASVSVSLLTVVGDLRLVSAHGVHSPGASAASPFPENGRAKASSISKTGHSSSPQGGCGFNELHDFPFGAVAGRGTGFPTSVAGDCRAQRGGEVSVCT